MRSEEKRQLYRLQAELARQGLVGEYTARCKREAARRGVQLRHLPAQDRIAIAAGVLTGVPPA